VLGVAALESGIDAFDGVAMDALWAKSVAMFDYFRGLMADTCPELECISPIDEGERGSHVSFRHANAFEICQALIEAGVIGDFRSPDVLRFGITPLYLRFEELFRAADICAGILRSQRWRDPRFAVRGKVT
jgi:kynureninase